MECLPQGKAHVPDTAYLNWWFVISVARHMTEATQKRSGLLGSQFEENSSTYAGRSQWNGTLGIGSYS